jgi:ABC-type polysaccharide/polyol phosphate transport system ATPase subunit
MNNEVVIKVENLSKRYFMAESDNLVGDSGSELWALNDVSFEIKKGESIGVVGPNGSGKSTLLRILAGVTSPTAGRVEISGRVASILDIGAGFNSELSGKDNVFLNGQILGFTKNEIQQKYNEIVDFSGIEKFIDEPVKNYSNGMYLRLAFSIMANLDFDIYLLDEVLSVGDGQFRNKVNKVIANKILNHTFVIVSHDITEISKFVDKYLYFEKGVLRDTIEDNNQLYEKYYNLKSLLYQDFPIQISADFYIKSINCKVDLNANNLVKILILARFGSEVNEVPQFVLSVKTLNGLIVFVDEFNISRTQNKAKMGADFEIIGKFDGSILSSGTYLVDLVANYSEVEKHMKVDGVGFFKIENTKKLHGFERGIIKHNIDWSIE